MLRKSLSLKMLGGVVNISVKAAFWGTVVYVGPIATITALGPGGFLIAVAAVHIGVPTVTSFL